jgi:Uma2 family endonuclease
MSMPATHSQTDLMTAEELEHVSMPDKQVELVRGHLVVREPPSTWHGGVAAKLTYIIGAFVYQRELGRVFGQDTGFKIASDPDTVRAPDVAFVSAGRLGLIRMRGYASLAPDLLAEVVSPDDRPGELLAKVADWLAAGARIVWVIDPFRSEARVYRADGSLTIVDAHGSLGGEDVLPGFGCSLEEVLS